jgi:hypothetical protein
MCVCVCAIIEREREGSFRSWTFLLSENDNQREPQFHIPRLW